jgi:hypothetical protein
MLHEELTKDIFGAAMAVLNGLKPGLDERLYENALVIELRARGHIVEHTTVRVLKGVNAEISNVYGPMVKEVGCERLEVFMRFSASSFFAKLPGCMLENLFSPNSPT